MGKDEIISSKIKNKAKMFIFTSLIQHSIGSLRAIKQEKKYCVKIVKEEINVPLFADDVILYVETN